jgi:hypothetical protein
MRKIETSDWAGTAPAAGLDFFLGARKQVIDSVTNTVRVPHPFPRLLRKWVGSDVTAFLPDQ